MGNHYKQTPFKIKGLLLSLLLILFTYPMSAQTDVKFEHQNQLHYFHNTHFDIINSIVNDITKEAPLTIFLPSIEAFNNLSPEQKKLYFSHPYTELIELLKSHMVSGVYTLNNLMDGMQLKTITGTNLYVKKTKDAVYINGAKISLADFRLFKSVFHIVDKVIIPGYTVYDIIKNSEVHNTLEAAIIAAKLDKTLQGEGPFTVFAPTDAAFKALPEGTVEALLNDPEGQLKQILLYHVVAGRGMSSDLINGDMIITLQGKPVKITIKDGHIYINNAKVTVADLKADNGVVHVIDAVLLTPTNTIYDIVSNSPDHTILKAAVDAAMLAPALKGNEVFTLFAPTDNAFKALPEGTVEALLEDPEGQLRQILLYHVVEGKALSSDLSDGQWI
ncbi:MAG: fasciclin domain-containing protein, partial [Breznakibacter sp.]